MFGISRIFSNAKTTASLTSFVSKSYFSASYPVFDDSKPFDKILINNRGEIACRVIRTARKMGIKTVAIYSTADSNALHKEFADEAYCVGPPQSDQSYLNIDKIIEVIKKSGAQAVHPGYGFLSESPEFVDRLEKEGITFIGPNGHAIHSMGDKIESKKLAKKAGVSVIPGYLGEVHTNEEVLKIANEITYPVMIKASAGGGGKGMRIAWNDDEAIEGFRLAKQEAKSSFGDDRILIEKYIANGRHIEIQVMGDNHGNAVYLNERECSIQRRNQKVIEEAPSSFIDPETREKMGKQAIMLCKEVNYNSAGTVEFIVDDDKSFYFLEMNTRLQVEHPITEWITGVDLVEQMLRSAAGQKLNLRQSDIGIKGWAMESRVYAEDPFRGFLPSIGRLHKYQVPQAENIRVDGGISEGREISIYYDPLISKLVVHGDNRDEAIGAMSDALDSYVIHGVQHNIPFLRDVMENHKFKTGQTTTKFIEQEYPDGFHGPKMDPLATQVIVSTAILMELAEAEKAISISGQLEKGTTTVLDPHERIDYFEVVLNGQQIPVKLAQMSTKMKALNNFQIGDFDPILADHTWSPGTPLFGLQLTAKKDQQIFKGLLQFIKSTPNGYTISYKGTHFDVEVRNAKQAKLNKFMPKIKQLDLRECLVSPMAGTVYSVAVKEGDSVRAGQELAIVEAMKMQNILRAPLDTVIKKITVKPGDKVGLEAILMDFEKQE